MKQIRPLLGVFGLLIAGTLAAPARADSVLALEERDILSSHPITNASRYSAPPPGQQGAPFKNPFPAIEYVGGSHLVDEVAVTRSGSLSIACKVYNDHYSTISGPITIVAAYTSLTGTYDLLASSVNVSVPAYSNGSFSFTLSGLPNVVDKGTLIIQFLGTALEGSHITTLYQTEATPLGVMDVA